MQLFHCVEKIAFVPDDVVVDHLRTDNLYLKLAVFASTVHLLQMTWPAPPTHQFSSYISVNHLLEQNSTLSIERELHWQIVTSFQD